MTNTPDTTQKQDPDQGGQRRLLRSPSERMLTGVAGGTASYLGVDPTFVRLGFVVASLFGGLGILVYLAMAVIVPMDDGTGQPVEGGKPPTWAIVLLVIAGLIILPGPFIGAGDGWFLGLGMLWLGALVLLGAGAYRAIRGRWPGQSAPGTAMEAASTGSTSPAERTTAVQPVAGDGSPPRIVRFLAIGLLVVCAIGAAITIATVAAWATATGSGAVVAGVVIALGVALAATAFIGDTTRRVAPWLLGLALILAVPAGAVAAADVRFDGGVGERSYTPTSVADIPDGGYEFGVGQVKIDLRELDFAPGETITVPAELGIGQLVISVPSNVCVTGHAEAKAGELLVRGESNSGARPEFDRVAPVGSTQPILDLDAELQFGQVVVTDRGPDEFDGSEGPGPRGDGQPDEIAAEPEACR